MKRLRNNYEIGDKEITITAEELYKSKEKKQKETKKETKKEKSVYAVMNLEGNTKKKDIINDIVRFVFKNEYYLVNKNSKILLIEGPSGRSYNTLKKSNIPDENIILINKDRLEVLEKNPQASPYMFQGLFYDIVNILSEELLNDINFVWYDGNATIFGNDEIKPYQDIELLLNKMNHSFTLAITFSIRSNHNRKQFKDLIEDNPDDSETDIEDMILYKKKKKKKNGFSKLEQIKILKKKFKRCGYSYDTYNNHFKYNSMAFWIIRLFT